MPRLFFFVSNAQWSVFFHRVHVSVQKEVYLTLSHAFVVYHSIGPASDWTVCVDDVTMVLDKVP